jgi:hypothetical protein
LADLFHIAPVRILEKPVLLLCSLITLIPTSIFCPAPASAATPSPRINKPICRIEIDNAHISRHELKFGSRRAVIVKARSICNVLQEQVTLTVNIYKVEKFGHPLLKSVSTDPNRSTSSGREVRNYDNLVDCKNFKRTKFYGIAYARALINGRWNYAGRTRSLKTIEINCGT